MKWGMAPFHVDRKDCHLTLDAVPAWVCEQCGEAYFEEKESALIRAYPWAIKKFPADLSTIVLTMVDHADARG